MKRLVHETITKQEIGFRWHITIEKEQRKYATDCVKFPDKIMVHASLEGHADTYDLAFADLKQAKGNLNSVLQDIE